MKCHILCGNQFVIIHQTCAIDHSHIPLSHSVVSRRSRNKVLPVKARARDQASNMEFAELSTPNSDILFRALGYIQIIALSPTEPSTQRDLR
jgi:hypothetical protein